MTRALFHRWRRRVLLGLLGTTLLLIIALAYKIAEKEQITNQQNLTIKADAAYAVLRNNYSILSAMVRQDFRTYTALQETIGQEADLSELVQASNISYESRIMESLGRLKSQLKIGDGMLGVIYLPMNGPEKALWYHENYPYRESVTALARDLNKIQTPSESPVAELPQATIDEEARLSDLLSSEYTPVVDASPSMHLIDVFEVQCMMFTIPLEDDSRVICLMNPAREFGDIDYHIQVADPRGTTFDYNASKKGQYTYVRKLYGLELTYSNGHKGDGFLAIILPTAFLILILLLYQSHVAVMESHTHELTGLPNMRTFERYYQQTLRRPGISFLFFLDLRNLKLLNTIFMEEQADEVIKCFAKNLRATLDRADTIIHRSGDELFILLTVQDEGLLPGILQRIRRVFADKSVRLRVHHNRDRMGQELYLHGECPRVGGYVDLPISFRIGGIALDYDAQQLPRKQLLDQVNLLAERAKQYENDREPGVVWMIRYRHDGELVTLTGGDEQAGPRLVELDRNKKNA